MFDCEIATLALKCTFSPGIFVTVIALILGGLTAWIVWLIAKYG